MNTRRGMLVSFLALCALTQGGCGFKPFLARSQTGLDVSGELAAIRVRPVQQGPDRYIGHMVRNALIDLLVAGTGPRATRFELDLSLTVEIRPQLLQFGNEVTRQDVVLVGDVLLYRAGSDEIVMQSQAVSISSHDVLESAYASDVLQQDAAEKSAEDLARSITNLLSAHFITTDTGSAEDP